MYRKVVFSEAHKKLFKTYKELQSILPFGFIKTKICLKPKYEVPNPSILKQLEQEKDKQLEHSPPIKTKNLLYNKNIYLYSNDNETKKIVYKLKEYQKIYNRTSVSLKKRFEKNNDINKTDNNRILLNNNNRNENNEILDSGHKYKSFSINNYNLKTNICLPSITSRMKNRISRNIKVKKGLSLRGFGKESLNHLDSTENKNDKNLYEINQKDIAHREINNIKVNKYKVKLKEFNIIKNKVKTEGNQESMGEEIGMTDEEKLNKLIGMRVVKKIKLKNIKP